MINLIKQFNLITKNNRINPNIKTLFENNPEIKVKLLKSTSHCSVKCCSNDLDLKTKMRKNEK